MHNYSNISFKNFLNKNTSVGIEFTLTHNQISVVTIYHNTNLVIHRQLSIMVDRQSSEAVWFL